jgi:arylsulfatase A-like enzyme
MAAATVVLALAVGGSGCGDSASSDTRAPRANRQPNVVVVMTDDQDVRSLALMPNVRRLLGDQGVTFTRSFVTTPECCPSRAGYLTGQYSHNNGVLSADPQEGGGYLALDDSNTLPVWLRAAGYETAHVGKYLNGYGVAGEGSDPKDVPPGWDEWHVPVDHTEYQMYGYTLNENGQLHQYGHSARDYMTDVETRKAVRIVRRSAPSPRPLFLSVAPPAPHGEGVLEGRAHVLRDPRPAPRDLGAFAEDRVPRPPSFAEADVSDKSSVIRERSLRQRRRLDPSMLRASYLGRSESLLAVDRMVARLVGALRHSGELADTYFFFTSDNGFLLGEHGLSGKDLAYEESARVPLVVRGPGISAGERRRQLVANIDLAPTIAATAGTKPGLKVDGRSLLPLARRSDAPWRTAILIEFLVGKQAYSAIRTADDRVLIDYQHGGPELYDLRSDPYELKSLAADPAWAPVRSKLEERLAELRHCAGAGCE